MIEWPIAVFLLSLVVIQEVWGSGRRLAEIAKLFWLYSQKAKSPSRAWTALIFISLTMVWFSVWESLLRLMLQATVGWPLSVEGGLALLASLSMRSLAASRRDATSAWTMSRVEWSLSLVGFALLIQAWFSAVFLGLWVYWRASKVLPSKFQKA